MANEHLKRTPTSTGNRKKWTWAGWVKLNKDFGSSDYNTVWSVAAGTSGNNSDRFHLYHYSDGRWVTTGTSSFSSNFTGPGGSTANSRDPGAWLHICLSVDTTGSNLVKDKYQRFWVNGIEYNYDDAGNIADNADLAINGPYEHYIGTRNSSAQRSYDGQMFDLYLVDGQALTPDVFGFYKDGKGYQSSGTPNATDFRPGQWMPHAPTKIKKDINRRGGFGVNGYYLPMNDPSNPGADFHCAPNSIIKLKGEDLPQPRNGAPATSDAFVSQVRKEIGGLGFAGCIKVDSYGGLVVSDHSDLDLGTGDYTIEGFYYIDDSNVSSGYHALFDFRGTSGVNGTYPAMFRHPNGHIYLYLDSAVRIDNVGIPTNEWTHVALSRSSGTTRLFVNGVEKGSFSDTISYLCRELKIGHSATQSNPMRGFISNFRVVKGTAVYTSNFTRPTQPLENINNTIVLMAQSATSATAGVAPATIATYTYNSNSVVFATRNELTGSISLAVAGAATGTGANLVTNGTFDTNTTGWTSEASATLSSENGRLKVLTTNTSYGSANQTVTGLTVGQRYTFQTNMYYGNDSLVTVLSGAVSSNSGWQSADFLWTYSFTAGSTSLLIDLQMASNSGKYGFWDNIILKAEDLPRDYSADIRGSGSNLTASSQGEAGIAYDIPSNYGSVMDFNTNSEVLYYNLDGTGRGTKDFTMECWFYPTREANTWGIIMQHATNSSWANGITINARYGNSRQFTIYSQNGSNYFITVDPNVNYEFNQWYHICAERYNNTLTLYVDGVAKASRDVTGHNYGTADLPSNSSQYGLSLSAQSDGSYPSDGYITDARVYDGVAKYKGGFDVPKPYTPVGIEAFRTTTDTCKNNFATLNPIDNNSGVLSNGNLTYGDAGSDGWNNSRATIGASSGKWYWEMRVDAINQVICASVAGPSGNDSTNGARLGYLPGQTDDAGVTYYDNGHLYHADNQGGGGSWGNGYGVGDIIGIALDMDDSGGKVWFSKNGSWQASGNPSTGANPARSNLKTYADTYFPISGTYYANTTQTFNFGQNSTFSGNITAGTNADGNGKGLFKYAPPTGFLALCEDNLPTPAIADPGKYFKTVLYTGKGTNGTDGSQSIRKVGFQPDLVWVKKRGTAGDNKLIDSVRGVALVLESNTTDVEGNENNNFTGFNSDGFDLGANNAGAWNENGYGYVAWCWKAGGAAVSNSDGSITTQVSANRTAGFSIVKGTQTSGTTTFGHGLGKAPKMVITKQTNGTTGWYTYHKDIGSGNTLRLDQDSASTSFAHWVTDPTTSVFSMGSGFGSGETYVAYCFAEVEGFSKIGSYIGNGNADGSFVFCGFKPAWVLIKNADQNGTYWTLFDSSRKSTNPADHTLNPNLSHVEETSGGNGMIDLVSNGFKCRNTDGGINGNNVNYVFLAFAESPFQTANAK